MKTIMVLANKYPNLTDPTTNMFIQQLAWEFADLGYQCDVVCPMPINFNLSYFKLPLVDTEKTENGNEIRVFRPKYLSAGQSFHFFQKTRVAFTTKMYEIAVMRVIKKLKQKPDFLYSYFLCPTSVVSSRLGIRYGIPAFMEHGTAIDDSDKKYGHKKLQKELRGLKGVIAVSNQNKGYVVDSGMVSGDITVVYPNCFREERFFNMSKSEARKHLGWDLDKFIVGYAGSFDERKGVLRLQAAVEKLDNVYFACAGKGPLNPNSDRCIWAKPVLHEELVYFYNALNAFVLPTLAEGSCTATAEAIGCGCPIISSNRPFNENLCDSENSIVVDPMNIDEIAAAIDCIHKDPGKEEKMRAASIVKSEGLKQRKRMREIANFMESISKQN